MRFGTERERTYFTGAVTAEQCRYQFQIRRLDTVLPNLTNSKTADSEGGYQGMLPGNIRSMRDQSYPGGLEEQMRRRLLFTGKIEWVHKFAVELSDKISLNRGPQIKPDKKLGI